MANGKENEKFGKDEPVHHAHHGSVLNVDESNFTAGDSTDDTDQDMVSEEVVEDYMALGETLDQLDSCLDELEEKNESLNAKLRAMLESSKETHAHMMTDKEQQGDGDRKDSDFPEGDGSMSR